ncbi:MAG: hypothetical protein M3380_12255 [Chloroflexota bacterium]|nr:hypothetical protein [Chloroflexota bacterium]
MNQEQRLLNQDEAATAVALDLTVVRLCAESGLIAPAQGYDEADLAELRRVRRLIEDLGLDQPAIEVVLRMRRRMLALQAQVQQLETELRRARRPSSAPRWIDAKWAHLP